MKILSVKQLKEADQYTIKNKSGSSLALMEDAARACYKWIQEHLFNFHEFYVFCGTGNNGGDGLALARMLALAGKKIHVIIVRVGKNESAECSENLLRLKHLKGIIIEEWNEKNYSENIDALFSNKKERLLIDAIIGSGLNKKINGWLAHLIQRLNALNEVILSIDIPTGLFAEDNSQNDLSAIIKANFTLTFQCPKLSFLLPSSGMYTGYFSVLDIGLDETFISEQKTDYYFSTDETIRNYYKLRDKFSHKGKFGHALIMAGSKGKMGAAILAARASLRTGAGLITVNIPACGYEIIQTALPEAMVIIDENESNLSSWIPTDRYDAIGIGPGIGTEKETEQLLKLLIQNSTCPLVLDADALNILSENKTWLSFLPSESILTPHPKEFERLAGKSKNDIEQTHLLKDFSIKYQVYVVLKGAYTRIATPSGNIYFNSTGNPGLAKGGSGDILTGIITSLLAQGYSPLQSSLMGAYIHGLSADFALQSFSEESMMASDIVEHISAAYKSLKI